VPWAFQSREEPDTVPVPLPFTLVLPAHVPLNVTLADVSDTGVTVYFTSPQLVAGNADDDVTQVPAKSESEADVPLGAVGFLPLSLSITSHAAVSRHAATSAPRNLEVLPMSVIIGPLGSRQQPLRRIGRLDTARTGQECGHYPNHRLAIGS
jgi:hypothetical protein